ncbi:MAG: acyl-CoA thioesterase domain-containing protein [Acidimicrobiia bacterium]
MSATDPSDVLLEFLTLEELDTNLYRAGNPDEQFMPHLYGGQVAAQALRAAAHTVPDDRHPHSLHGYFLRGGRPDRPTIMAVDRDRDGGSFSARHVNALQDGEVIFSALASFHVDEEGIDYHVPGLPEVDAPESLPEHDRVGHNAMFDVRYLVASATDPWASSRMWVRPRSTLPDDRVMRACVLTYVSDMGWAFGAVPGNDGIGGPSLDHAVWFHRSIPVDQWMLLDLQPVSVAGARGVYIGTIHDRAGTLAASIAQEVLLRSRR